MYNIHVSVVNRLTPIAEVSVPSSKGILVLRRLLLSIQYPNVEEMYINVLVLFILKKLPILISPVSN